MRGVFCLPLLLLATGCWQPRYFTPRENLNGTGPDGSPAAVYPVRGEAGSAAKGEVRVWSSGAMARFTDEDDEVVDLHIGFEIENTGQDPLQLEVATLGLEEVFVDGLLQEPLEPHEVKGAGLAAPGLTTRVDLVFRPPTTYPRDVDSFSVRFSVRGAAGVGVGQLTPFIPDVRVSSYSDPGWGWSWGYSGYYGGYYGAWGWPGGARCR